jgi:hypothetical protein
VDADPTPSIKLSIGAKGLTSKSFEGNDAGLLGAPLPCFTHCSERTCGFSVSRALPDDPFSDLVGHVPGEALFLCAPPDNHPMPSSIPAHPGLVVLSRLAAAVLGGYALAAAAAVFFGAVLPSTRADAVLAGMQFSFAVHTLAVIWAFSPVSPARVWAGLLVPAATLAACGWLWPRLGS